MSKADVESMIGSSNVVIFSKSYCPYCDRTKALFTSMGVRFNSIELDQRKDGSAIQQVLRSLTGQSTVPNVFVKGNHIGGNDDTHEAYRNGSLQSMLGASDDL
jgi:glutaredoxin 3